MILIIFEKLCLVNLCPIFVGSFPNLSDIWEINKYIGLISVQNCTFGWMRNFLLQSWMDSSKCVTRHFFCLLISFICQKICQYWNDVDNTVRLLKILSISQNNYFFKEFLANYWNTKSSFFKILQPQECNLQSKKVSIPLQGTLDYDCRNASNNFTNFVQKSKVWGCFMKISRKIKTITVMVQVFLAYFIITIKPVIRVDFFFFLFGFSLDSL